MRNPRRTATTASALMIGLALVTLVSIIGASAKQSFEQIIDDSVRADFLVQGKGFISRGFTPAIADSLQQKLPGATGRPVPSGRVRRRRRPDDSSSASAPNVEDAIDIKLRTRRPTSTRSPPAACW